MDDESGREKWIEAGRKRASMTTACAEILIDVPAFDAEDST
jgi:hypothetical protein